MPNNRSTKDFKHLSKGVKNIKKSVKPLFEFPVVNNLNSKLVKFYTFNAGFKKKLDDLLIIVFNKPSPVTAVYSKTSTPSAPIIWDKKNNNGFCKILIVNSGNANAHTGKDGIKVINDYVKIASKYFNCPINQILVSSTGVIGEKLDHKGIVNSFAKIKKSNEKKLLSAAQAIMTTDTFPKTVLKTININSKKVRIFGIAKGSGMIFPNMGTMLAYIFIEANLSKKLLNRLLNDNVEETFNSISVDGDTSTSDTVMLFSLFEKNEKNINKSSDIKKLQKSLRDVMSNLSLQIVSDGEGISKLIQIDVQKAISYKQASAVAFSIANSSLVKTAIAGEDANWGRVIAAIGKADSHIIQNKIKLKFGKYLLASNGKKKNNVNTKKIDSYMHNKKINIKVDLGIGSYSKTVYSSDLTHEYISINADYRS